MRGRFSRVTVESTETESEIRLTLSSVTSILRAWLFCRATGGAGDFCRATGGAGRSLKDIAAVLWLTGNVKPLSLLSSTMNEEAVS